MKLKIMRIKWQLVLKNTVRRSYLREEQNKLPCLWRHSVNEGEELRIEPIFLKPEPRLSSSLVHFFP